MQTDVKSKRLCLQVKSAATSEPRSTRLQGGSAVVQGGIRLESRGIRSQNGDPEQMWKAVLRSWEGRIVDEPLFYRQGGLAGGLRS